MTYTGDVLIQAGDDGDIDMTFENGQPLMTDGFETCVQLAVFGEPCPQNAMGGGSSEKFTSTFPEVIRHATVTDTTRQDGEKSIEAALAFMVSEKMASSVKCTGSILSARSIGWEVEIIAPSGMTRYALNWEKGSLTVGFKRIA
jgi:phage gp46-like protein